MRGNLDTTKPAAFPQDLFSTALDVRRRRHLWTALTPQPQQGILPSGGFTTAGMHVDLHGVNVWKNRGLVSCGRLNARYCLSFTSAALISRFVTDSHTGMCAFCSPWQTGSREIHTLYLLLGSKLEFEFKLRVTSPYISLAIPKKIFMICMSTKRARADGISIFGCFLRCRSSRSMESRKRKNYAYSGC